MAASDSKRVIRNAPYHFTWVFRDANGNVKSSVGSVTPQIAKDAGALTTTTNSESSEASNTLYRIDLTATEMDADLVEAYITGSGVRAVYERIEPEPSLTSGVATAGTSTSITFPSTSSSTEDIYNGAIIEIVRGTGAGQVRTITNYTTGRVATVDRAWETSSPDTTSVFKVLPRIGVPMSTGMRTSANIVEINGDSTAATNLEKLYEGGHIPSSVDDASPTTTSFIGASGLSTTDDFYNDMILLFTSGTLKAIPRKITDYTGSTRTFTTEAFPAAPSNGDTFVVLALVA